MKKIITVLYILFALIFCFALYTDNIILQAVTKPVPVILLMVFINVDSNIFSVSEYGSRYGIYIFSGFIFSLAGDIFLLKTVNNFLLGLASFLVAHIFYIAAFRIRSKKNSLPALVFFYTLASVLVFMFYPFLPPDLLIPVIIYIYVIITMVYRSRQQKSFSKNSVFAFAGAVLFAVSDFNIAVTEFVTGYKHSETVIIILYWTAQYLIALSVFPEKK
ncbi:MAG: lysoplasmalogenase [Chlorobi bacterium]|nr:lysoplasmalogenase [Chlorobiota bacterium]